MSVPPTPDHAIVQPLTPGTPLFDGTTQYKFEFDNVDKYSKPLGLQCTLEPISAPPVHLSTSHTLLTDLHTIPNLGHEGTTATADNAAHPPNGHGVFRLSHDSTNLPLRRQENGKQVLLTMMNTFAMASTGINWSSWHLSMTVTCDHEVSKYLNPERPQTKSPPSASQSALWSQRRPRNHRHTQRK